MSSEKTALLPQSTTGNSSQKYVLVIHGGAGAITREQSTPAEREQYKQALAKALVAGYHVLRSGGEALDAAVAAVNVMEDCPLFNSGKGAVFNVDGKNELETSVMVSKPPSTHPHIPQSRRGLGLTLLTRIKNPSSLARELYLAKDTVPHTFLSGRAAEDLCRDPSQIVDPSYYFTKKRWVEHRRGLGLPETPLPPGHEDEDQEPVSDIIEPAGNTVGAVALDIRGCIASVTSTGGKTSKLVGRVGDTPCMGSGFWAEEWQPKCSWPRQVLGHIIPKLRKRTRAVGVSGTGNGDYFIRLATGATIGHRMKYLGKCLSSATQFAVEELRRDGGEGGVIALDAEGNASLTLNCPGMYRGIVRNDGVPKTAIFADEDLRPTTSSS